MDGNGLEQERFSPLLSNLALDEFDRELERRGHGFVAAAENTAVYGPVRTVVWQGSAGGRRPYADQGRAGAAGAGTINYGPICHSTVVELPVLIRDWCWVHVYIDDYHLSEWKRPQCHRACA